MKNHNMNDDDDRFICHGGCEYCDDDCSVYQNWLKNHKKRKYSQKPDKEINNNAN